MNGLSSTTVTRFKASPENRLEWLEDSLSELGWAIKDREKALVEVERADGLIEITKANGRSKA